MKNHWEKIYRKKKHYSIWPWSDVVSNFEKFSSQSVNNKKLFEIGCGAGANIPYFLSKGLDYHGCDLSKTIVDYTNKRFSLNKRIIRKNFLDVNPKINYYDFIVDRASVTHNYRTDIIKIIEAVHLQLKKNGKFFGIDWYSTKCSDFKKSNNRNKIKKFRSGNFKSLGNVYFSNYKDMKFFFKKFKILKLEEKIYTSPKSNSVHASWIIVVEKK